jgi:hypothetical protein
MKYTAKISQAQFVGTVKIEPKGGEISEPQAAEIKKDPWGKELIRKGLLVIEGVRQADIEDDPKKGAPKEEAPSTDTGINVDLKQGGKKN